MGDVGRGDTIFFMSLLRKIIALLVVLTVPALASAEGLPVQGGWREIFTEILSTDGWWTE